MSLPSGTRLGAYEVITRIGSGGMGDVYRAKDLKLGRDVAIKVLRGELASDPDRVSRFEREARSASALNHPNIIHIYTIDRVGSSFFIAMEYVEGKTLREIVSDAALPVAKLLEIGSQLADGLAKAHAAGIIHRDLKPENIMVTEDGFVKILDFGLAKLTFPEPETPVHSATTLEMGTQPGVIMGTVGYMSPEQARGGVADHRSDQFSLAVILYEMATGNAPFRRATAPQTLAAIIEDEIEPVASLLPEVPRQLSNIIGRCLSKQPFERYDSTRDLALELKSIREAVRRHDGSEGSKEHIDSIAVMPLANLSADPEQEFFSDGMTEALLTDLAKIGALKVISRTSVMRYKGTTKSLPEIARELGVDAIIEGSVLRAGDRVRISVQLIDAKEDKHLWAESYERDLQNILSLQSEVARAVAKEIQIKLTLGERERLTGARAVDPAAHEAYLKGRYYFYRFSPEAAEKAIHFFRQAIEKEPGNARGYAGLADAFGQRAYWGFRPPSEVSSLVRDAAMKAAELDDTLAEVQAIFGGIKLWLDWDWTAGAKALQKALELNPNDTTARLNYSFYLAMMGRTAEAVSMSQKAKELDPLNLVTYVCKGWNLCADGQYDLALDECRKALEIDSNSFITYIVIWKVFWKKNGLEDALGACKQFLLLRGYMEALRAVEDEGASRDYRIAMKRGAEALADVRKSKYVPATDIAILHVHAQEPERSLYWLERAVEDHDPRLHFIGMDPDWELLHREPRFLDILRRLRLPLVATSRGRGPNHASS